MVQRLVRQALKVALQRLFAHQIDDQAQPHFAPHGGFAKNGLDVEQPDAAHFQQVLQQLGAAAFEHGLVDAVDIDGVVGH